MKKMIVFFLLYSVSFSVENRYTIKGEYPYKYVLSILAEKSKRSVLGQSAILNTTRHFDINDKTFFTAVDHVRKNLYTENFSLSLDSSCFYVRQIVPDTILPEKAVTYEIFQPFKKRWVSTTDREQYLNALHLDNEEFLLDSIKRNKRLFLVDLKISGFVDSYGKFSGVKMSDLFSLDVEILPGRIPRFQTGVSFGRSRATDSLRFSRGFRIFVTDTNKIYHFGNEIRRTSGKMQTENILTENYESVYDGLTFSLSDTLIYNVSYRINGINIELSGISDSLCYGSADFNQNGRKSSFFVPSVSGSIQTFYLASKATIIPLKL